MSNKKIIPLAHPINVDGAPVSEITLRRLSVGDLLAAQNDSKNQAESEIRMVANLSGIAFEDILKIDVADYGNIQAVIKEFTTPGK